MGAMVQENLPVVWSREDSQRNLMKNFGLAGVIAAHEGVFFKAPEKDDIMVYFPMFSTPETTPAASPTQSPTLRAQSADELMFLTPFDLDIDIDQDDDNETLLDDNATLMSCDDVPDLQDIQDVEEEPATIESPVEEPEAVEVALSSEAIEAKIVDARVETPEKTLSAPPAVATASASSSKQLTTKSSKNPLSPKTLRRQISHVLERAFSKHSIHPKRIRFHSHHTSTTTAASNNVQAN